MIREAARDREPDNEVVIQCWDVLKKPFLESIHPSNPSRNSHLLFFVWLGKS